MFFGLVARRSCSRGRNRVCPAKQHAVLGSGNQPDRDSPGSGPARRAAAALGKAAAGCSQDSRIPAYMAAHRPLMERGELCLYQQGFHRRAASPGSLALTSPPQPVGFSELRSFPPAGGGFPSSPLRAARGQRGGLRRSRYCPTHAAFGEALRRALAAGTNAVLGSQYTKVTCSNSHFYLE